MYRAASTAVVHIYICRYHTGIRRSQQQDSIHVVILVQTIIIAQHEYNKIAAPYDYDVILHTINIIHTSLSISYIPQIVNTKYYYHNTAV